MEPVSSQVISACPGKDRGAGAVDDTHGGLGKGRVLTELVRH
ncbi:uncharacterized protein METZ01_LOCUS135605 [marine metagenome]|uniref:Uncharacterized protein n=1 Tax=marine metagenome TaxID=408172 RepID=A0A381Z1E4_9ZZZZ